MSREKIIFEWDPTRLKLLLEKSGLSYDDAANKIGISRSALFKYCHGELNPSLNSLIRMASYFNVPLDYLVGTYSETDYEPIRKHYDDYFRTIQRDSYEKYLVDRVSGPQLKLEEGKLRFQPEWPYNFFFELIGGQETGFLSEEQKARVPIAIRAVLTEQRAGVLLAYYYSDMTLQEIGDRSELTKSRTQQIMQQSLRLLDMTGAAQFIVTGKWPDFTSSLFKLDEADLHAVALSTNEVKNLLAAKAKEKQNRALRVQLTEQKQLNRRYKNILQDNGIDPETGALHLTNKQTRIKDLKAKLAVQEQTIKDLEKYCLKNAALRKQVEKRTADHIEYQEFVKIASQNSNIRIREYLGITSIQDTPMSGLGLSPRLTKILLYKLKPDVTVNTILDLTVSELWKTQNAGEASIMELLNKLRSLASEA